MKDSNAAMQRSKDAMMAARNDLFKKMRAIEYQIEGLDIAIRVLNEFDGKCVPAVEEVKAG